RRAAWSAGVSPPWRRRGARRRRRGRCRRARPRRFDVPGERDAGRRGRALSDALRRRGGPVRRRRPGAPAGGRPGPLGGGRRRDGRGLGGGRVVRSWFRRLRLRGLRGLGVRGGGRGRSDGVRVGRRLRRLLRRGRLRDDGGWSVGGLGRRLALLALLLLS